VDEERSRQETGSNQIGDPPVDQRARVDHVDLARRDPGGTRLQPEDREEVVLAPPGDVEPRSSK